MKIKNVSGTDLTVPWLGGRLVVDGQEVDVPARTLPADSTVFAYTQQESTWEPADDEAQAAHDEGLQACLYVLLVEGRVVESPEAAVAELSAKQIIAALGDATREQVEALLEVETRPTVTKAAEKRLADLDEADNNGGDAEGSDV